MILVFGLFTFNDCFSFNIPGIIGSEKIPLRQLFSNSSYFGIIKMKDAIAFEGFLIDKHGEADISGTIIGEKMVFTKRYSHRDDEILYSLENDGQCYNGNYQGIGTGEGSTKCLLVEIGDENLFQIS